MGRRSCTTGSCNTRGRRAARSGMASPRGAVDRRAAAAVAEARAASTAQPARSRTRRDAGPRTTMDGFHAAGCGGPWKSGTRRRRARSATCASMRASAAPRQKWLPRPKERWRSSRRPMSKRSASLKWAGSRLAAARSTATIVPGSSRTPASSTGWMTARSVSCIGGSKRRHSSTAPAAGRDRPVAASAPEDCAAGATRRSRSGSRSSRSRRPAGATQVRPARPPKATRLLPRPRSSQ